MDIASLLFPTRPAAKAQTGIGSVFMQSHPPITALTRTPQQTAREAQQIGASDATIRAAERVIASRFSTAGWELEDRNGVTVGEGPDDNSEPGYLAIRDLLRRPYNPQAGDPQTQTPRTWAQLTALTCRHMGLCGVAFWYLDQAEALAGTPLSILYINPARMTPVIDRAGALTGWVLDKDKPNGDVPLEVERVIPFYLEPPDEGVWPHGLVESAIAKSEVSRLADRHVSMTLAAGGRLSGIMSPKEGFLDDAVYHQLVRDIRTIAEAPDAAKRMLILRGPVEYTQSSASLSDLDLVALSHLTREDKLALWGVPHSILGLPTPGGLGGGTSKDADEAIFWQNAVGPRLRAFAETLQTLLLDRYAALGLPVEIEFEEPEFDDRMPQFDMAAKSMVIPMTTKERRDLLGLDPFGDERDDEVWLAAGVVRSDIPPVAPTAMRETEEDEETEALDPLSGKAAEVPAYVRAAARRGLEYYDQGKAGDGLVAATVTAARDLAAGRVSDAKLRRIGPWIARHLVDLDAPQNSDPDHPDYPGAGAVAMLLWGAGTTREQALRTQRWAEAAVEALDAAPAKAKGDPAVAAIRRRQADAMTKALSDVLAGLAAEVAKKVEKNYDHIARRPGDVSAYWDAGKAEALLMDALTPHVEQIAQETTSRLARDLAPGKAGLLDSILPRLLRSVGARIKTVADRTLIGDIRTLVEQGIADGLGPREVGRLIEDKIGITDYRSPDRNAGTTYLAERIARTEAMFVQNAAAIETYRDYGVTMVRAIDGGDPDEEPGMDGLTCAERNGRVYPLSEAMSILDHPNGTLDWAPVAESMLPEAAPAAMKAEVSMPAITVQPQIVVNVPEQPAPVVHVAAPEVHVAAPPAPVVNVTSPDVNVVVPEQKAVEVMNVRVVESVPIDVATMPAPPPRRTTQVVVRGPDGKVVGAETVTE